jgi:hypothetical protein
MTGRGAFPDRALSFADMRKRFLSMGVLVIALLSSAWGNVIAAAFCPRYALNRNCTKHVTPQPKQAEHQSSCHEQMADMKMGDMQMDAAPDSESDANTEDSQIEVTSESSSDEVALDLPIEPCPHCLSHSQSTSGTVSVVAVDPSKRLVETNSPPADSDVVLTYAFFSRIECREHGPPGESPPRHILINVFRI